MLVHVLSFNVCFFKLNVVKISISALNVMDLHVLCCFTFYVFDVLCHVVHLPRGATDENRLLAGSGAITLKGHYVGLLTRF